MTTKDEALALALGEAATSLETISRLAGKTHYVGDSGERVETYMGHFDEVRGYAASRASVAREAITAIKQAQQAQEPVAPEEVESAWRAGWAACRDAEYVGQEAEDEAWGMSQTCANADWENAAPKQAEPLTDAQIDRAALEQTGFDGYGTQAMNNTDIRRIVRAVINQPKQAEPEGYKLVPVAESISGERLPRCKKCGDAIFGVSSDACRTCNDLPAPKQLGPESDDKFQIEKAVLTLIYAATFGSTARYEDGTPTENRLLQLDCAKYLHSLVSADEFESAHEFTLRQFDAMPPCTRIEGWKLVPIEPTQGMLDMARVALEEASRTMARHAADKAAYRAMLAAAPTPPEASMTQELRRLAEAATQGEWSSDRTRVYLPRLSGGFDLRCIPDAEQNAAYIAAANPAAILELIDRLEKAEKDAERYRWLRERYTAVNFDWEESGQQAVIFTADDFPIATASCDETIDCAMEASK